MQEYIQRLIHCGYSPSDAYSTCWSFVRDFSLNELMYFIRCLEEGA